MTSATSRSSDRRHHLPYYGGLTLWQYHASLAKHLRPQLQHLGVVARERVFYQPHDKVLHSLVVALLDEPVLYACLVWYELALECKLMWEQEEKIMLCDVSTMRLE